MSKSKHHKRFIGWIASHSHATLVHNPYAIHVHLCVNKEEAQQMADHIRSVSTIKCVTEVMDVESYLRLHDPMDTYIVTEVYAY